MNELTTQEQIDAINRKLDFLIEEVMLQRQARESREDLLNDLSLIGKDAFKVTVEGLDKAGIEFDAEALSVIFIKLIQNLGRINDLLDTFESLHDLVRDASPIVHQMGFEAINKMAEFERKGYLDFVRELGRAGENILNHFTPEDAKLLADNVVNILATVKRITQPDMMVAMNNAISVYGSLDMNKFEEYSVWKAMRELRSPEMKKGMGFLINFVKNLARQQEMNRSSK